MRKHLAEAGLGDFRAPVKSSIVDSPPQQPQVWREVELEHKEEG